MDIKNKLIIDSINPISKEQISSVSITTEKELKIILDKAKEAATEYKFSSYFQRKSLLKKFRKEVVKHLDELIKIITLETGKKNIESLMEIFISLEHLSQSSKNLNYALKKSFRKVGILKTRKAWVEYEPMGVAGIISPWNYPLILTMSPMVEALLAGNAVVLKPSEQTPLTSKLLKKIWDDATGQNDLFQVVYGKEDIGNSLVVSNKTDIICFTGSTNVGREIAIACAPMFKPLILELGGKDPMIILEDADINKAIEAALWGGLSNAGQTCISVEHILVHEKIYSIVVDKLSQMIKNMNSGIGQNDIGAISVEMLKNKINNYINEVKENSKIVQGCSDEGSFIPPTLIINPPLKSKLLENEIFGPIITINSFKNNEQAIRFANNSGYGLSASIFGKNKKNIYSIAKRIKTGTIIINDVMTHYGIADLPFGGVGLSGIGKVHGKEGLRAFSKQKSYVLNKFSLKTELWWFARRERFGKFLRKWIKWNFR